MRLWKMNKQRAKTPTENNQIEFEINNEVLKIRLRGSFIEFNGIKENISDYTFKKVIFIDEGVKDWDSSLLLRYRAFYPFHVS